MHVNVQLVKDDAYHYVAKLPTNAASKISHNVWGKLVWPLHHWLLPNQGHAVGFVLYAQHSKTVIANHFCCGMPIVPLAAEQLLLPWMLWPGTFWQRCYIGCQQKLHYCLCKIRKQREVCLSVMYFYLLLSTFSLFSNVVAHPLVALKQSLHQWLVPFRSEKLLFSGWN